jgi:hypothetical protein
MIDQAPNWAMKIAFHGAFLESRVIGKHGCCS